MNLCRFLSALIIVLITTQILRPAMLWASVQHGIRTEAGNQAIITAISETQLTVQSGAETNTLHFRDPVKAGDQIATGDGTVAEVLIGRRSVVRLKPDTTVKLATLSPEQTTIQVTQGIVRVVASAHALGEQGAMIIQMPAGQVLTRGGIIRVMVNAPVGAVEDTPASERKATSYLTSASPNSRVAALGTRGDIIQVEEGVAEITGADPGDKVLKVQTGQRVTLQAGQVKSIAALVPSGDMHEHILASADHSNTPKQGLKHLVERQVDQATQLALVLTGRQTGQDNSAEKDNVQNAIIGSTGGQPGGDTVSNPPPQNPTTPPVSIPPPQNPTTPPVSSPPPQNPTTPPVSSLPPEKPPELVSILFGIGTPSGPSSQNTKEHTGSGFGGNNNNGFQLAPTAVVSVKMNGGNALLVFTRKDPIDLNSQFNPVALPSVKSQFTVAKELVLVGGEPNNFHSGIAPMETLIIRGAAPGSGQDKITNLASSREGSGLFPTDRFPAQSVFPQDPPKYIVSANSTLVGKTMSKSEPSVAHKVISEEQGMEISSLVGGTLGQFSNDPASIAIDGISFGDLSPNVTVTSFVDGAITATGSSVTLTGGVTLDQGTQATIGTTTATDNYFSDSNHNIPGAKFDGSLLAVIDGPNDVRTAVTVEDRLLGVYDGSTIETEGGNKALLSVLDAKLTGPAGKIPLIDIDAAKHFEGNDDKLSNVTVISPGDESGDTATSQDGQPVSNVTSPGGEFDATDPDPGSKPNVTVTSAVVTRSTKKLGGDLKNDDVDGTLKLDAALLEASAPLLALTQATMTTTSHFADLAGNQAQSILLNDALVALNAATLTIESGHLLNLHNATATVNGYLFSLNDGSTLTIEDGALFSLNNGSVLNLNAEAFGVFGSGSKLSVTNNLCATGSACGTLMKNDTILGLSVGGGSAEVVPLKVAGVSGNVKLPDNFNVFAAVEGAAVEGASAPTIEISTNGALFVVDNTSTLHINGKDVVNH